MIDTRYLDIGRTVTAHYGGQQGSRLEELLASLPRLIRLHRAVLDGVLKGTPKARAFKENDSVAGALKDMFLKVPAAQQGQSSTTCQADECDGVEKPARRKSRPPR